MRITHVRNATLWVETGGLSILVDPMLGARGSLNPFRSVNGDRSRNPLVDLVVPLTDLLSPDLVIVTHTHADHWDPAAAALLPRAVPVIVQHDADAELLRGQGFTDVTVLADAVTVGAVVVTRTEGRHGTDAVLRGYPQIGEVMGVVIDAADEPRLYVAGDTVLHGTVRGALHRHRPDVVVVNAGEAQLDDLGPLIMGADDVLNVAGIAPEARIVAVHMEALNHCSVTRAHVRALARAAATDRILVPDDGDRLEF